MSRKTFITSKLSEMCCRFGWLILLLVMGLFYCGEIQGQEIQATFVIKGAFLLSEKTIVWKSGRPVQELIGYLHIGTVVYFVKWPEIKWR